jgi:hypothetical protein
MSQIADKLANKLNVPSFKLPWSEMTAKDIINWPSEVEFIPISKMKMVEVKILHKLAKADRLDFSPEFINQFKESKGPESKETNLGLIKEIETALCNQLNAGTNKNFRRVPWTILQKEDIINWPEGIPFVRLSQHTLHRLKLLHKLRKVIFFRKEFLQRLSDPNFDRYLITQFIAKF